MNNILTTRLHKMRPVPALEARYAAHIRRRIAQRRIAAQR